MLLAMSFFPVNQVRLTNVAVVRYKKGGKRFEIACYKNKVMDWRNKREKDLDNVLQLRTVFSNVSKGERADKEDLEKVFGTDDEQKICIAILEKGDLQISDKERKDDFENRAKEIATIIAAKCINRETKRPFPVRMIESSLKEVNFVVKPNKSAKQQALQAVQELQKILPIDRAQMRIRLELPAKVAKEIKASLAPHISKIEEENKGDEYELVVLIDPGEYRTLDEKFQAQTKGKGTLEILDLQVQDVEDRSLES